MTFLAEWSNWFTSNRFDWISKAKNDLCTHLEHPFTKQLVSSNSGKNVNLALFGKTQVGKTTLILKLMGIKAECFQEIASLLRCGSDIGYSATPTAMIYRISNSCTFNIIQYNTISGNYEESKDLEYHEIKEILVNIRYRVESNQYDNSSELIIDIPRKYFCVEEDHIDLNVIDLPGLNSRSIHEREWTKKLIKQFLPAANIVLVLDRGNQVTGFLDLFDDEELNNITNWKYFPEKYRVITTYSYSAESVRNQFQNAEYYKPDELVAYYRGEIRRSLVKDECNNLIIYPLEYGESWEAFCNEYQENRELWNIKEVNQFFFKQLIQDISIASSELNQISLLLHIGKAFQRRRTEYEEDLIKTQKTCEEHLSQIDTEINNLQSIINDYSEKIESINQVFPSLNNIYWNEAGFYNYSGDYDRDLMYRRIEEIKSNVKSYIGNFESEVWNIIDNLKSKHPKLLNDGINELIINGFTRIKDTVTRRFEDIFSNTISQLASLWHSKRALGGLWGPDDSHIDSVNNATANLNEYMKCVRNEVIKPNIGPIYDFLGNISYHQDLNRSHSESHKSELKLIKHQQCDNFNNEMLKIHDNIKKLIADIERASLVTESITSAKDHFIHEYLHASSGSKGTRTLLNLLQAVQIEKDYLSSARINGRDNG